MKQIWFNFLVFLVILLASLFIHKESFDLNYPGLIDDGIDILEAKENNYWGLIKLSVTNERTRPVRLIIRKILYDKYDGENFYIYHIINAVSVTVLIFLVYLILNVSTKKRVLSFLCSLSIFLLPQLYANSIRLGTDEIYQVIFLLFYVFFLHYKKYKLSFLFFLLNLLIKESGIFYIFIPLYYFLDEFFTKKISKTELIKKISPYIMVCLLLVITVILKMSFLKENSYITRSITLEKIYQNIFIYKQIIITILGIAIFNLYFLKGKFKKILNILTISSMGIYLVWDCGQDYYYLPTMVFSCIYFSNILIRLLTNKISQILISILLLIAGYMFCKNITKSYFDYYLKYEEKMISLTPFLIGNDFSSTLVYLNLDGFEKNDKANIYLTEWNKLNKFNPKVISDNDCSDVYNLFLKESSKEKLLISHLDKPELDVFYNKKIVGDNFFYIYTVKE